jgi:hypothetical protein
MGMFPIGRPGASTFVLLSTSFLFLFSLYFHFISILFPFLFIFHSVEDSHKCLLNNQGKPAYFRKKQNANEPKTRVR